MGYQNGQDSNLRGAALLAEMPTACRLFSTGQEFGMKDVFSAAPSVAQGPSISTAPGLGLS